jgi:hypothetical protein
MLYKNSKSEDKTIKRYKDQNHELLWEPLKDDVHNDILEWFENRCNIEIVDEIKIDEKIVDEKNDELEKNE